MCFAQGHNTVQSVRLEPATPWSQDKNSMTETLHSLRINDHINDIGCIFDSLFRMKCLFRGYCACSMIYVT